MTSEKLTMEQLCNDIVKARHDKLVVWIKDTVDLFEMANLPEQECLSCITSELLATATKLISRSDMPTKDFGEMMRQALEQARRRS